MTKQEFIEKFSMLNDFESKAAAARAVPQPQAARSGITALTGKPYSTPAKVVPKFKAAKAFKTALTKV